MKIRTILAAAGLAAAALGMSSAATAQNWHGDRNDNGNDNGRGHHSRDYRGDGRYDDRGRDWRGDRGRHWGWNNHHRRCWTEWRYHHRVRICD